MEAVSELLVYIYIYVYTHTYMYTYTNVRTSVHVFTRVCVCALFSFLQFCLHWEMLRTSEKGASQKRAGALIATQDFVFEALELWGVQHACVLEAFQF